MPSNDQLSSWFWENKGKSKVFDRFRHFFRQMKQLLRKKLNKKCQNVQKLMFFISRLIKIHLLISIVESYRWRVAALALARVALSVLRLLPGFFFSHFFRFVFFHLFSCVSKFKFLYANFCFYIIFSKFAMQNILQQDTCFLMRLLLQILFCIY